MAGGPDRVGAVRGQDHARVDDGPQDAVEHGLARLLGLDAQPELHHLVDEQRAEAVHRGPGDERGIHPTGRIEQPRFDQPVHAGAEHQGRVRVVGGVGWASRRPEGGPEQLGCAGGEVDVPASAGLEPGDGVGGGVARRDDGVLAVDHGAGQFLAGHLGDQGHQVVPVADVPVGGGRRDADVVGDVAEADCIGPPGSGSGDGGLDERRLQVAVVIRALGGLGHPHMLPPIAHVDGGHMDFQELNMHHIRTTGPFLGCRASDPAPGCVA